MQTSAVSKERIVRIPMSAAVINGLWTDVGHGVETTFSQSAPSAHVGIEIPLGRRLIGYLEVIGTTMRLRNEITTATQVATATVSYAPVAVEASLVLSVF